MLEQEEEYDVDNSKSTNDVSSTQERLEDLKRILNGRLFLEFHLLDLKE